VKPKLDMEILDHLAGLGSPEESAEPHGPPAGTSESSRRYEDFAALWRAIGSGEATPPPEDLWPAIADRLRQEQSSPAARIWGTARLARMAAAVLLAVTLGHLVGRGHLAMQDAREAPTAVAEADIEAKVSEEIHFDALGSTPILQFAMSVLVDTNHHNPKENDDENEKT